MAVSFVSDLLPFCVFCLFPLYFYLFVVFLWKLFFYGQFLLCVLVKSSECFHYVTCHCFMLMPQLFIFATMDDDHCYRPLLSVFCQQAAHTTYELSSNSCSARAVQNKIQTQKGSNKCLFILTPTHSMQNFGEIPFIKPQNNI